MSDLKGWKSWIEEKFEHEGSENLKDLSWRETVVFLEICEANVGDIGLEMCHHNTRRDICRFDVKRLIYDNTGGNEQR